MARFLLGVVVGVVLAICLIGAANYYISRVHEDTKQKDAEMHGVQLSEVYHA